VLPQKVIFPFAGKEVIMKWDLPRSTWPILIASLMLNSCIFLASCHVALVAPLTRDSATLQYVMEIEYKTPLQKEKLVLDLSGDFMWVRCKPRAVYKSSTYLPIPCHTPLCTASGSVNFGCGHCLYVPSGTRCVNNTCTEILTNWVTGTQIYDGELSQDVVALSTSDGIGQKVKVPEFAFVCAPPPLLRGLARGAAGIVGMNWGPLALPFQLSVALEFDRKFALCLPSGDQTTGSVFFGSHSFGSDKANIIRLNYTFLVIPMYPREYFLGVSGIAINQKKLPIDSDRLKVNVVGSGGTTISSVVPYTRAATPIYTAIVNAFVKEAAAMNISRVASVKPFGACFDANTVKSTKVGPAVPIIELLLDNEFVYWRIYGGNSMVQAMDGVLCLAFVDAGADPFTAIVIGSYQLQDNLLLFDMIEFKLFFSSSLLAFNTSCSNLHAL